jgi:ketosteroid isomerase-like protein
MSAREDVEAMIAARHKALVAGDLEQMMVYCTEDYVLIFGDAPPLLSRAAVKEMYGSIFSEAMLDLTYEIEDLRVDGALATVFIRELLSIKPHHGTKIEHFALRRLSVLILEGGAWKFARSMINLQALAQL